MSNHLTLHNLRQRIGNQRQPEHASALIELHNALGHSHPYALNKESRDSLKKIPAFGEGGRGRWTKPPGQSYLYRLTSVGAVKPILRDPIKRVRPDGDIFTELESLYGQRHSWISLDEYAQGMLSNDRGFTWWTDLDLQSGDLLLGAHQIGLPSGSVAEEALMLRCTTTYFSDQLVLHVPTVLDAFDSEIFHPTESARLPNAGRPISLSANGPLTLVDGVSEFVATAVAVTYIEFIPVRVTREMRHRPHVVELNANLRRLLEEYYSTLLPTK